MVIWFDLAGVRVNGVNTVWCSCRFQLSLALGMTYFKTEPPSIKEFHDHLTVQ